MIIAAGAILLGDFGGSPGGRGRLGARSGLNQDPWGGVAPAGRPRADGAPYRDIEFEKSARSDEEDLKNGDYEWPDWLDGS
jgi:hypothetical protein